MVSKGLTWLISSYESTSIIAKDCSMDISRKDDIDVRLLSHQKDNMRP